jgi:hypothetical protein
VEVDGHEALVYELLRLYRAGRLTPEPIELGPLPEHATSAMRAVAEDMALRLGLLLAEGFTRPMIYAGCEPMKAGFVSTTRGGNHVLSRLHIANVIRKVGEASRRGKPNGSGLWVPPSWRPEDPRAVELAREHGLENTVWIPGEPRLIGRAVEPGAELADELLVDDRAVGHALEPSCSVDSLSRPGRREGGAS